MTEELFYGFLSGLCWLFGLDSDCIRFFRTETGRQAASIIQIAVYAGLINVVLLYNFRIKRNAQFYSIIKILAPAAVAEIALTFVPHNLLPDLRAAAWIMLSSCGVIYLLQGVELKDKNISLPLAVCGFLIPLHGSLSLFLLLYLLYKSGTKTDSILGTVVTAFAGLAVIKIIKTALTLEAQDVNAVAVGLAFAGAAAGGASSIYLLNKAIRKDCFKVITHGSLAIAVTMLFLTSRYGNSLSGEKAFFYNFKCMGTSCEITLWSSDEELAGQHMKEAKRIFDNIENTLSTYKPESEISQLNKNGHLKPHKCSSILWENLMMAKKGRELSDGAFDVTVGPLVKLWRIKQKRSDIPSTEEIEAAKRIVGFEKLIINTDEKTVMFPEQGFKIDFGGLTKGWAVDRARDYLIAAGFKKGIINLGGNLYCFEEPPPEKEDYTIGIKDPRQPQQLTGRILLLDNSISTSGNYEQFIIIDGVKYSHIISPLTGMPVKDVDSVTVVHRSAALCDMMSTAIFAGSKTVREKLKAVPDFNFLFIDVREGEDDYVDFHGAVFEKFKLTVP